MAHPITLSPHLPCEPDRFGGRAVDSRPMAKRPRKDEPAGPPAIHAPWRSGYIDGLGETEKKQGGDSSGSFIRGYWLKPGEDSKNHVIVRTGEGIIFLNRYPYAGGHLLVALGEPRV